MRLGSYDVSAHSHGTSVARDESTLASAATSRSQVPIEWVVRGPVDAGSDTSLNSLFQNGTDDALVVCFERLELEVQAANRQVKKHGNVRVTFAGSLSITWRCKLRLESDWMCPTTRHGVLTFT